MKFKNGLLIFFVTILLSNCNHEAIQCEIVTTEGSIIVELYPEKAPITVENFLRYADAELYNNTSFFRVCTPENEADREIKIQVIQAADLNEATTFPPIQLETTELTGIKHLNGVISMARDKPHSATSSFFICINDQPELDYQGKRNPDEQGFGAFGKVIRGMDVVLKIQAQENTEQQLLKPVIIKTIKKINE
jgi:peptidyl-prolyl cis-trans isomerase A (cyclophilin A)